MSARHAHPLYEFGDFELDALRRVLSLRADGRSIPVTGKVLDALLYFVERPGRLLDKRELMEALWSDVVVEEGNLTQTIHTLRRTLGEKPGEHRYIVTVPGRGYRFVADVRSRDGSASAPPAPRQEGAIDAPTTTPRRGRWRPGVFAGGLFAAAIVALLIAGAGIYYRFQYEPADSVADVTTPARTPAVAVLPFVDMSPERDQEYFADGLSEEILNLLAQSTALRVIARTSSFSFKGSTADIAAIAKQLNVTHVLEGSVRKAGDRLRITAQLVDTGGVHVWSQTYDRDLQDVFSVQGDIAGAVAESLHVTLTGDQGPRRLETTSAAAFERYLQGRYFFHRRGKWDITRAREYFQEAVEIDPHYARAWAGLAGSYYIARSEEKSLTAEEVAQWRKAAQRAVALAPDVAEVQMRIAQYHWTTGDGAAGTRHFERAVALNPSDPLVLGALATLAKREGRFDDAVGMFRRAVAVDPLSSIYRANLGAHLLVAGHWNEAAAELRRTLEINPTMHTARMDLAKAYVLQGRTEAALNTAAQLPEGLYRDQTQALVYHTRGDAAGADAALERLIAQVGQPERLACVEFYVAEVYAYRGDGDEAFRWLELARRQMRDEGSVWPDQDAQEEMQNSVLLKGLHEDPRWQAMLASVDS